MPLYEYQCESCGHRFEVIQRFDDPPVEACPQCAGAVRKLLSSPAIQFKGTGWYITDYARKPAGGASEAKPSKEGGGEGAKQPPKPSGNGTGKPTGD
ncbi:MAG TPA: FmdB family zinc ribbon protein [Vicinamibacterales bacterium]|nr:FmdB family zinc ribbon protein [Vicinamibacterales bacterium]